VPFEVAAVMLLVAMIGGIILAGKKMEKEYIYELEQEHDKHHTDYIHSKDSK
jgi:NADH-quinone oxidoreductase subunit J